jgi:hypothetical protein
MIVAGGFAEGVEDVGSYPQLGRSSVIWYRELFNAPCLLPFLRCVCIRFDGQVEFSCLSVLSADDAHAVFFRNCRPYYRGRKPVGRVRIEWSPQAKLCDRDFERPGGGVFEPRPTLAKLDCLG